MARRSRKLMGDINVVPYIDVMLVLLIIFMLTAPMMSQGIKVDLPKAGAEPLKPNDQPPLILSVDKRGQYYLSVGSHPDDPLDAETVTQRVSAVLRRAPETHVLVKADALVPYGQVVQGMVLLQHAGAEQVGFVTDPATASKANRK